MVYAWSMSKPYVRPHLFDELWNALTGEPSLIQVVIGPRQVGKTTMALQILERWKGPKIYATADSPDTPNIEWISTHWERARRLSYSSSERSFLILDEVQKIPHWSELVKKLADQDRRQKTNLRVLVLSSSALLVQKGLIESLAGRFELHRHPHWQYKECHNYFNLSLEDYFLFGGYPGALSLRDDPVRWSRYIRDALIETVIGKDVLLMATVQKPALLRQVFGMACAHPAEIVSYTKMMGQLMDAGNTVTIANYLHLLSAAFFVNPLSKWSGSQLRRRGSIPKIVLRDNSLINSIVFPNLNKRDMDAVWRGRLVENCVGAALTPMLEQAGGELFYWRDRQDEVDYVIRYGQKLIGVEVKSGKASSDLSGLKIFKKRYPEAECVVISTNNKYKDFKQLSLEDFFNDPKKIV